LTKNSKNNSALGTPRMRDSNGMVDFPSPNIAATKELFTDRPSRNKALPGLNLNSALDRLAKDDYQFTGSSNIFKPQIAKTERPSENKILTNSALGSPNRSNLQSRNNSTVNFPREKLDNIYDSYRFKNVLSFDPVSNRIVSRKLFPDTKLPYKYGHVLKPGESFDSYRPSETKRTEEQEIWHQIKTRQNPPIY